MPVAGRFEANDVKALVAAALNGAGIMLAPEVAVRDDLAAGRLVRLLNGYEAPPRPMHVVFSGEPRDAEAAHVHRPVVAEFGPSAA